MIDKYFQDNSFLKCSYEHALYLKVNDNGFLLVYLYIDDFIFYMQQSEDGTSKQKMSLKFEMIYQRLKIKVKEIRDNIHLIKWLCKRNIEEVQYEKLQSS